MKKVIAMALLASSLMAGESGMYLGVDVGDLKVDGIVTVGANTYKGYTSDPSYMVKGGYYLNQYNRLYAFYQYVDVKISGVSSEQYGAGYDYLIGDNPLKPFIGAFVGRMNSKADNAADNFNISGNVIGVQAGLNYAINTNFSLEGGYRYFSYSSADGLESVDNVNVKSDTAQNWFAGLNYKF